MLMTLAFVCFAMLVLAWVFLPSEAPARQPAAEERVVGETVPA